MINNNLRVNFVNPAPSIYTWIHLQLANGIQEVIGSIPIGSTRGIRSAALRAAFFVSGVARPDLTFGYARPRAAVTPRNERVAVSRPPTTLPFRQRPRTAPSRGVRSRSAPPGFVLDPRARKKPATAQPKAKPGIPLTSAQG